MITRTGALRRPVSAGLISKPGGTPAWGWAAIAAAFAVLAAGAVLFFRRRYARP